MSERAQLINFIAIGFTLLFVTLLCSRVRKRVLAAEEVRKIPFYHNGLVALLFITLWILLGVREWALPEAILTAAFLGILFWMAEIDALRQILPDACNLAVLLLALLRQLLLPRGSILSGLLACLIISVPMLLLSILVPGAFGGGDIKLTFAWGFFLGWKLSLLSFFLAILSGGIYAAVLLLTGKKERTEHFAFGPFLCLGAIVSTLYGSQILTWYLGLY